MEVVALNDTFLQFKSFDKSTFVLTVDELSTIKHPDMTIASVKPPPPTRREQQTAEEISATADECSNSNELSTNAPTSSGMAHCEKGAVLEVTTDANIEGKYIHFVICYATC